MNDSRLFISVCPLLEHLIPEVSDVVVQYILGDGIDTAATIQRMMNRVLYSITPEPPALRPHVTCDMNAVLRNRYALLQEQCNEVCMQLKRHLVQIAKVWNESLYAMHDAVCAKTVMLEVECMKHEHHQRSNTTDMRRRMRTEFDDFLRSTRARFVKPIVFRPQALRTSCDELRLAFRHGRMPTRVMLQLKRSFERQIALIERSVAKKFIACVSNLVPELDFDNVFCA